MLIRNSIFVFLYLSLVSDLRAQGQNSPVPLELEISPSGKCRVYVDAEMNGVFLRIALDTGAVKSTVPSGEVFRRYESVQTVQALSALGKWCDVDKIVIPYIGLGPLSMRNVRVGRALDSTQMSHLGMDIFQNQQVYFDFGNKELRFFNNPELSKPPQSLKNIKGIPQIEAVVNGRKIEAFWDTGAEITLFDKSFVMKNKRHFTFVAHLPITDACGDKGSADLYKCEEINIDGVVFKDQLVMAMDLNPFRRGMKSKGIVLPKKWQAIIGLNTIIEADWWFDFRENLWAIVDHDRERYRDVVTKFPEKPERGVADQLNILKGEGKKEIENILAQIEKETGTQLFVLTLFGRLNWSSALFRKELLSKWKIGEGKSGSGGILMFDLGSSKVFVDLPGLKVKPYMGSLYAREQISKVLKDAITQQFDAKKYKKGILEVLSGIRTLLRPLEGDFDNFPPRPEGLVGNFTGYRDEESARTLEGCLEGVGQRTESEVMVLAINSKGDLEGRQYLKEIMSRWKVGSDRKRGGILISYTMEPSSMNIRYQESKGQLTGEPKERLATELSRIMREVMIPKFRTGNFAGGYLDGCKSLESVIMAIPLPE